MKRINTGVNEYNAILYNHPLTKMDLSELQKIIATESQILWISFTMQQTKEVWKEINNIIATHNPLLQLSFQNEKEFGQWTNLSFLEYLPDLKKISINEWLLQDLSPIGNLTQLKRILILNEFKSKKPSLKPLENLKNIEDFSSSHIKDIETISGFKKLKKLSLDNIKTSNLDFLVENKLLESIWLRGTDSITNFSGLSYLPNLEKALFIRNYKYQDLDFISDLVNLKHLDVSYFNQIKEIPSLKLLTKLTDFTIIGCKNLLDYSKMTEAKSLENIFCSATNKILTEHFEFLKYVVKLKKINIIFSNQKKNKEVDVLVNSILKS